MQKVHLRHRPHLKRRRITTHSRKIDIVQPVAHRGLARNARKALVAVGPRPECLALRRGELVVALYEACSDEEDVADVHVAALRFWAEV